MDHDQAWEIVHRPAGGFKRKPEGFDITFPNGVFVSVQFAKGSYCDNQEFHRADAHDGNYLACANAEVYVSINRVGVGYPRSRVTPAQFARILSWAAAYEPDIGTGEV